MKCVAPIRSLALALALGQASVALAQDSLPYRKTITLRDTGRPLFIRASIVNGNIKVRSTSGHEILIEAVPSERPANAGNAAPSLVETNSPKPVSIREEDNRYYIILQPTTTPVDLTIQAPMTAHLRLHSRANGNITVEKMGGEIEAEGFNGDINIDQAADTVIAHTGIGKVNVSFKTVKPDKAMSFTTVNGDINLWFPANLKAHVRLDSVTGKVTSDFNIDIQQPGPRPNRNPSEAKTVSTRKLIGSINGGAEPDLQVKSLNGSIQLRKKPETKLAPKPDARPEVER